MVTFEQWVELMKLLGDPNGAFREGWFKDALPDAMEFAAAHTPRLHYTGDVVCELKERNGDYTLWLPPQLSPAK